MSRRRVVTCESGTRWLVLAASERAALAAWPSDADPPLFVEPASRSDINYLRGIGQADVGA